MTAASSRPGSPGRDAWPAFSPDGRWLAYATFVPNPAGRFEVYVRPYPAGGPAVLVSTRGGSAPSWSRDGRTLFYVEGSTMMAVDVAPGSDFRPGRVRRYIQPFVDNFIPVRMYDVLPDGSFVLAVPDPDAPAQRAGVSELDVILNIRALLEERFGGRQ